METIEFSDWLERKYVEWQGQRGKRATLAQFADYIGISAPLLSHYMNGIRRPTRENIQKFARRFGSETYDIFGLQDPDPKLRLISRNWSKLTPEQQQKLIEGMESLLKANDAKRKRGKDRGRSQQAA